MLRIEQRKLRRSEDDPRGLKRISSARCKEGAAASGEAKRRPPRSNRAGKCPPTLNESCRPQQVHAIQSEDKSRDRLAAHLLGCSNSSPRGPFPVLPALGAQMIVAPDSNATPPLAHLLASSRWRSRFLQEPPAKASYPTEECAEGDRPCAYYAAGRYLVRTLSSSSSPLVRRASDTARKD